MASCPNCGYSAAEARKLVRASARDLVEGLTLNPLLRQSLLSIVPDWPLGDVQAELEAFKDRMRTSGYRTNAGPVRDASAAFRTHLRNAIKFAGQRSGSSKPTTRKIERKDV